MNDLMRELGDLTRKAFVPAIIKELERPLPAWVPPPVPMSLGHLLWVKWRSRISDAWKCLRGTHIATDE